MKKEAKELWSARVTRESQALALAEGVFTWDDPRKIAASLKRSAEESLRRKGTPFQSAMSMLNFYINRAGRNLPKSRLATLGRAKEELRDLFGHGRDGHPGQGGPRT
jgi:hypothetical protein